MTRQKITFRISVLTATLLLFGVASRSWADLPAGWTDADIGSPSQAGSASETNGEWAVSGGGSDIWNNADQCNFTSVSVTGNGSIVAQVLSVQNSDPGSGWSKAGVMFRSDTSAGAINAAVVATPGNGVSFQWRNSASGISDYVNVTGLLAPIWVRLIRLGTNFTASYSADGLTWTPVGSTVGLPIANTALAGLAVTAHNSTALNTSTFSNVSITSTGLPAGWTDIDIGSPASAGSASVSNGQWTVSGGGADIWSTSDQFNLASEVFDGEGSISAQVASVQNTDPATGWSKAGVMFRNDTTAGAVNAVVVVTPSNGVSFQWRTATGGASSNASVAGLTAPIWLKLTLANSQASAFYSASGTVWTQVGSSQSVELNNNLLAGFAVTAHNNSALNTAVFGNVSVSNTAGAVSLPVVTNLPPQNVQATTASLEGRVIFTGNQNPSITLLYGQTNGGTNAFAWANAIGLPPQSGNFALTVTGLTTNSTFYYTAMASNAAGIVWAAPPQTFTTLPSLNPQAILTFHYDNTRAGANTNETILTPRNVNVNNFGKLFTYTVDGFVYAQALVSTNVTIPGRGVHNVLYIATEHDTVYAFDADNYDPVPYWTRSFIDPAAGIIPVPGGDTQGNVVPEVGITATPVIDPTTATIYIEARTKETSGANVSYVHRLHALDLATGQERSEFNSPVAIECTNYPGTGTPGSSDTDGAGHILWNGLREHCRPALLLSHGNVYIAFASPGDHPPYYGWVFAYDAKTLAQTGVFNDAPNAGYGGIWMTGNGIAADSDGFIYFSTGNGNFDTNSDYGDSVLKLNGTNGLQLADYFTPYNQDSLNSGDIDVSSAGLLLLPDSAGTLAHPHLLLAGSKANTLYLIDRDAMGHFNSLGDTQIVQSLANAVGGMWSSPTYFNGMFYVIGTSDVLKAFRLSGASMGTTPASQAANGFGSSSTPTITANGTSNAVVWALDSSGTGGSGGAVLHAYNATNVAQELYNSTQNSARDYPGVAVEFTLPAAVNGKVYTGAQYAMSVFGNGSFLAVPTISPNGEVFSGTATVTLADPSSGVELYYTLDGTNPDTNSTLYTGPFTLTNTASVRVVAIKPGYINSAVVAAGFVNSSSSGAGTGLMGQYFANQIGTFANPPTLTRVDPTVDFVWPNPGAGPDPSIGDTDYSVRWIGSVQPQFNDNYTFAITVDDGGRLFINGQNIIDGWADQPPTTYTGSIALKAQQLYTIEMDYYQRGGGAEAELAWSSPSLPQAIIPASQLYPYTNPPPAVVINSPANGASYTAISSVTINASADAQHNSIESVTFYTNGVSVGSVGTAPYILTTTGFLPGSYVLTAVVTDGSGITATSSPVNITINPGSGLPYGLTNRVTVPPFFNMPQNFSGNLPPLLSQTGVFADTPNMVPVSGLIPYSPNVPLWSDGAVKTRWLGLPFNGVDTSDQQIGFSPTGSWSFPTGTIFVKHFALVTNETDPNAPLRRLETRLLVRDPDGSVYGVTYKWRPDYSDADLLDTSTNESIAVTTSNGVINQTWYYPSPGDCLKCHTSAANYVLGVNTRQLNGNFTYPSSEVTDNQLRTFNQLGLFNPAIDSAGIPNYSHMSALTNVVATLQERARSYIDANCAQCHQPGGSGPSFDARYDTPLTNQNIINGNVIGNLGYDNAHVVTPDDIWRSILYQRADSTDPLIKMPPLARNLIDTNAMAVIADWINSLPGTPALAPPAIIPNGGSFAGSVNATIQPPNTNATIYYTLDGSLPTTSSLLYSGPILLTNSVTLTANAFEGGFASSVATSAQFEILSGLQFTTSGSFASNGVFQLQLSGISSQSYVLQASTNLVDWISIITNSPLVIPFNLSDTNASNFPQRFYRAIQAP